ncbi:hypothetical protein EIN_275610 [Entamoeba invadens IP1]|uniref:Ras-GEF domain-containing protein n=1 Tax=Entamoeba invadens IP1 TaxID=370355 RepID=L7FLL1_ENTIV|nr:hypothetical protein EIN_275610 [Entamoeba invadens IP1]ELP88660.1 hypothetical protein EIN_275610 [Entamoeba invadens IP1]|eukprot:XP_004255431.1 hypothetical protein EIN_275610 [Entamoeba invadens IP1]
MVSVTPLIAFQSLFNQFLANNTVAPLLVSFRSIWSDEHFLLQIEEKCLEINKSRSIYECKKVCEICEMYLFYYRKVMSQNSIAKCETLSHFALQEMTPNLLVGVKTSSKKPTQNVVPRKSHRTRANSDSDISNLPKSFLSLRETTDICYTKQSAILGTQPDFHKPKEDTNNTLKITVENIVMKMPLSEPKKGVRVISPVGFLKIEDLKRNFHEKMRVEQLITEIVQIENGIEKTILEVDPQVFAEQLFLFDLWILRDLRPSDFMENNASVKKYSAEITKVSQVIGKIVEVANNKTAVFQFFFDVILRCKEIGEYNFASVLFGTIISESISIKMSLTNNKVGK